MDCTNCNEPIPLLELAAVRKNTPHVQMHLACLIRSVVGSVGHQQGTCSCYGGLTDGDPDGMTPREAAHAAAIYFKECRSINADPYGWNRS